MLKLTLLALSIFALASYADIIPHNPGVMTLSAAVGVVLMVWAGLFARV